nr:11129_t:CDS:2 [Entrophospora candida]
MATYEEDIKQELSKTREDYEKAVGEVGEMGKEVNYLKAKPLSDDELHSQAFSSCLENKTRGLSSTKEELKLKERKWPKNSKKNPMNEVIDKNKNH